jgi:TP901 family phage tail tape measure protein
MREAELRVLIATEMRAALRDFNNLSSSVDQATESVEDLNQGLASAENAADQAGDGISDFARLGIRSTQEVAEEMNDLRAAFTRMEQSGEESLEDVARAARALDRELERLEAELEDVDDAASDVDGDGFRDIATGIAATVTAALSLSSVLEGITFFAEFDDELRKVKAFSKATADEFRQLEQLAIDIGRRPAQTPREVAAGMVALAQAGQNANDMMRTTAHVASLAADSELDFAEAAAYVSKTISQFQLDVGDAGRIVDNFVQGSLSATQTAGDFGEAMSYVGSIANTVGYDLEETGSLITALAAAGLEGSRGGTSLAGGMSKLINPVGEAKDIIEDLNLELYDTNGQFRDFSEILGDIGEAGISPREQLTLFGLEAGPGMAALLAIGQEAIEEYEQALRDAEGTAQEVTDVMHEGVGGSLRTIASEAQVAILEGIEPIIPLVQLLAEKAYYLSNGVQLVIGPVKAFQAALMAAYGSIKLISGAAAFFTDLLGLTSGQLDKVKDDIAAAFGASKGLLTEAGEAYRKINGESEDLAESQKFAAKMTNELNDEFKKISKETGVTIKSMEDVDAALASGALRRDEITGDFVSAEQDKQAALKKTAEDAIDAIEDVIKEDKKARKAAEKIWKDYAKTVLDIQDEISERERDLADQLADMAQSGMSEADALKAIKEEAAAATKETKKLAAAGDFEGALRSADAAKDAWASVAGSVRAASSELEKSKKELKEARSEYKKLKREARKDGIIDKKEKKKIREARKEIKDLKKEVKENGKALRDEKAALQESMDGVQEAGELGIEILEKQKAAAEESKKAFEEAFDFTDVEENIQKLIDDKIAKVGTALADDVKAGVDSAVDDAQRLEDSLDEAAKDRTATITITERTIQAAFHGGQIWGPDRSAGGSVFGPTGYDSVKAILSGDEFIINNRSTGDIGSSHFYWENTRQWDKALKSLASFHGPEKTRQILAGYLAPPEMAMVPDMPRLEPAHGSPLGRGDLPNLGTIVWEIGNTSVPVQIRTDHAALVQQELAKIKKGDQIKARAQGRGK